MIINFPLRFLIVLMLFLPAASACSQTPDRLDREIGQMLMVGFRGTELSDTMQVVRDIRQERIGGVILFDYDVPSRSAVRNIERPTQLERLNRQLMEEAETPLMIAIDQEGGNVSRLKSRFGFPSTRSAAQLGSYETVDSTRHHARRTARLLSEMGFNANMAPVADLNSNAENPIIGQLDRAFSADAEEVYRHARAWIAASREQQVIPALKHFPGHGSSADDSHLGVVDVTESWERRELIPYRKLIDEGYSGMVMTAHIFNARLDSTWPATLSPAVIGGLLRDSLGFDGVVISDDMQMEAIRAEYGLETALRQAILAGVDILVFANNSVYEPDIALRAHRIIRGLVDSGEISAERIRESYERIMKLKRSYGIAE